MNIVVFDTEDNSEELKAGQEKEITQIAAISSKGQKFHSYGNDKRPFLKWLRRVNPSVVYAHNVEYDIGNLFRNELEQLDYMLCGKKLLSALWKSIEFRDSLHVWPLSVAKLGESFGLKKLDRDVHSKAYVFRDCEIVMRAMQFALKMAVTYKLKRMPYTLGGFASKTWKSLGGKNWYCDCKWTRQALFGGRVELFQKEHHGLVSYCDINSLYPYVMTFDYPFEVGSVNDITGFGVAGVTIRVPRDTFIAPLPVRTEDGSIIYPVGTLEGVWTFHEIRNAIDHGAKLLKIHSAVGTQEVFPFYRDFMEHFYQRRLESKEAGKRLFYKLLMNNLYGHLGMRNGQLFRSQVYDGTDSGCMKMFGNKMLVPIESNLPDHVNYLHAAYVTSYGRLELLKYLYKLGERLLYCDTDSVIFTGKPPFAVGSQLGQMKLVSKSRYFRSVLPKTYILDEDYVAKGVPKKHAKEFILRGSVTYKQPYRWGESVRFYSRDNRKPLSVWHPVTKRLLSKYAKKRLSKNTYWPITISS